MPSPGRSTVRSPEVEQAVLDALADGKNLRQIAKGPGMPAPSTVCGWADQDPAFAERYARAREAGMDRIAEETIEIADDGTNDTQTIVNEDGSEREIVNTDHIQRSKLRVDTRKWILSKLAPKRYGDRIATEVSGPDGGAVEIRSFADLVRGLPPLTD